MTWTTYCQRATCLNRSPVCPSWHEYNSLWGNHDLAVSMLGFSTQLAITSSDMCTLFLFDARINLMVCFLTVISTQDNDASLKFMFQDLFLGRIFLSPSQSWSSQTGDIRGSIVGWTAKLLQCQWSTNGRHFFLSRALWPMEPLGKVWSLRWTCEPEGCWQPYVAAMLPTPSKGKHPAIVLRGSVSSLWHWKHLPVFFQRTTKSRNWFCQVRCQRCVVSGCSLDRLDASLKSSVNAREVRHLRHSGRRFLDPIKASMSLSKVRLRRLRFNFSWKNTKRFPQAKEKATRHASLWAACCASLCWGWLFHSASHIMKAPTAKSRGLSKQGSTFIFVKTKDNLRFDKLW